MSFFINFSFIKNIDTLLLSPTLDAAETYQFLFQCPATMIMDNIIDLHDDIFSIMLVIATIVFYLLIVIIYKFRAGNTLTKRNFNFTHHTNLKIVWTLGLYNIFIGLFLLSISMYSWFSVSFFRNLVLFIHIFLEIFFLIIKKNMKSCYNLKLNSSRPLVTSEYQPQSLVRPSPWPFLTSLSLGSFLIGSVSYFHFYPLGLNNIFIGLFLLSISMYSWFSVSFFSVFFLFSLTSSVFLFCIWPPKSSLIINPWGIPFLNTIILLSSGVTLTIAHRAILTEKTNVAWYGLFWTIIYGLVFTFCQLVEYINCPFSINDSVYGSIFFMATGFHGLHVIVSTIFLLLWYVTMLAGEITMLFTDRNLNTSLFHSKNISYFSNGKFNTPRPAVPSKSQGTAAHLVHPNPRPVFTFSSLGSFLKHRFFSTHAKDVGTSFVLFGIFSGMLGTYCSILIRAYSDMPANEVHFFLDNSQKINLFIEGHAFIMIFFMLIPILFCGFGNWFIPVLIDSKDKNLFFPLLNYFSFWLMPISFSVFLLANVVNFVAVSGLEVNLILSNIIAQAGPAVDLLILSVQIAGISFLLVSTNFIFTIFFCRDYNGETQLRLPLFVWSIWITAFLVLLSVPVLAGGITTLFTDRSFNSPFFDNVDGVDIPVIYRYLFWFFTHPNAFLYFFILPALGIIGDLVECYTEKPVIGYNLIILAFIVIGFVGYLLLCNDLGINIPEFLGFMPVVVLRFVLRMSMVIFAVLTAVILFFYIFTLVKFFPSSFFFGTPLYFIIGFLFLFVVGTMTGFFFALDQFDLVSDRLINNNYYFDKRRFHFVLYSGLLFAMFAGFYGFCGAVFGLLFDDQYGKIHFWLLFIGVNVTFLPIKDFIWVFSVVFKVLFCLCFNAFSVVFDLPVTCTFSVEYPVHDYPFWNLVSLYGSFFIPVSTLWFFYVVYAMFYNQHKIKKP